MNNKTAGRETSQEHQSERQSPDLQKGATRSGSQVQVVSILLLTGILLNAFLIRTQHISDVSFWFDEACSWKISTLPNPEMLEAISNDVHPPLYYVLLSWLRVTIGDSIETLRGVSIFFGLATIVAVWWLLRLAGQEQSSSSVITGPQFLMPLLGALLISLNPFQSDLSDQARPYTIGTFLSVMTAGFALQITRNPSRWPAWGGLTICGIALSFTHYFCLFTLAGILIFLIWQLAVTWWTSGFSRELGALLKGMALSFWICQLAWIFWWPSFLHQNQRGNRQAWMAPLDWNVLSQTCWKALSGGQIPQDDQGWAFLGPVIWLAVCSLTMLLWGRPGRLIGLCALAPPLFVSAYGLLVRNILGVRYLAFGQLFFLICCAMLIAKLRPRLLQIASVILIISWSVLWLGQFSARRAMLAEHSGLRQASDHLAAHRKPDEPVFVSHLFGYLSVYRYLFPSSSVYLSYGGNHRSGIGTASLTEADYRDADQKLKSRSPRLWTVDIPNLNGRLYSEMLSPEYRLVSQERFIERNFFELELIVSEYALPEPDTPE